MVADGGHLVHVLRWGVDQRICGVKVAGDHRVAPVVGQQRHDRLGRFGLAAVDELAVLVVGQGDVLRLTEGLQA